jgi:xylan 1,4-beta-xylosidase
VTAELFGNFTPDASIIRRVAAFIIASLYLPATALQADEGVMLQIDFARTHGVLRPLHGINKGPLAPGGLIDLTQEHRALRIPFTRLHDCHWPNPDVVDIHAVFPDFGADPEKPESYHFGPTDEYLEAIQATGAQMVYRLGESIEHTKLKRFVHPPRDPDKWAAICLGIIRHYNEGWANGFRHRIRYWEIWNEPENRPAMWTGTDEEYFRLYRVAARSIKLRYPELKVGGPSVGASGGIVDGEFQPSAFVLAFLDRCRREKLPLDFFSWHCYTDDPAELVLRAKGIRRLLDAGGFTTTESHLNEWNFLPDRSWEPLFKTGAPQARQQFHERMAGAPGAAFIVASLLQLQDAPVDVCNLFHGELGGFGLFNEHGVPLKNFHALRAFAELLQTPQRVAVNGAVPAGVAVGAAAGRHPRKAAILISNFSSRASEFQLELSSLPWSGMTVHEIRLLDERHDLATTSQSAHAGDGVRIKVPLASPALALIVLQPMENTPP